MSLRMSKPLTRAVPLVGGKRPVSIDMDVDFPAPLWPSRAVIWLSYMLRWMLLTANLPLWYSLVSPLI